jgi:uncharacterized protein YbjT (DUF2867 family)
MFLVTGATGNVGSQVVAQLLARGERVRVFVRDANKVAQWGDRVEIAVGEFAAPERFARAVAGADGVFLMNGSEGEPFARLIAAAHAQGKPRIVFLSTLFAGLAGSQIGKLHKDKEDAIRASGLRGTFVRPGGFMSNAYQWIGPIKAEGVVYNVMGAGRFAPIAPEDIAAVVVQALTAPRHSSDDMTKRSYDDMTNRDGVIEITGRELLTVQDQVGILSDVLGRPLRCVDVPSHAAIDGMIRAGMPQHVAAAVAESFDAIRDGRGTIVNDTVARVTGHPPKTFETWAREHATLFA